MSCVCNSVTVFSMFTTLKRIPSIDTSYTLVRLARNTTRTPPMIWNSSKLSKLVTVVRTTQLCETKDGKV